MRSRLGLQAKAGLRSAYKANAKQNTKGPGLSPGPIRRLRVRNSQTIVSAVWGGGAGTYVDLRIVSRERVTCALIGSVVSAAILVLNALISLA
jgi:hypothetical protein